MKKILLAATLLLLVQITKAQPWIQQNAGLQTYSSGPEKISIVDANITWCLSFAYAPKEFSKTIDGGNTWVSGSLSSISTLGTLTGIAALDANTAFICATKTGGGGVIFKTIDGGANWAPSGTGTVFPNAGSYPDDIYFWDAANGFVFGDQVAGVIEIYTTTDSGNTWVQVPPANIPFNSIGTFMDYGPLVVIDSTIWFPTVDGFVFKSTNKGQNWTRTEIDSTLTLFSISFLDDKLHGLAYMGNTDKYQTSDGGNTWTPLIPSGNGPWAVIRSIPGTNYFVSVDFSSNSYSAYSSDYGNNWITLDSNKQYFGLTFKDVNTGYAGGIPTNPTTGGIYKWNPLALGIQQNNADDATMIYPNPASTFIIINCPYLINEITIVDLLGSVVYKKLTEGTSLNVDISYLRSDIYFLNLKSQGRSITRKFVKL